jgi:uncharacterized membrane protein
VSRYDWLLFLHVLAAIALVTAVVIFGVVLLAARGGGGSSVAALRLTPLGQRLLEIGGLGTIILGIWLAIDLDDYGFFDGWVITAVLLWAIAGGAGARLGAALQEARTDAGGIAASVSLLYAVTGAAVAALLVVMIYKPGA